MIYEFEGKRPSIGKNCYIAKEATVIGNVIIGEGCYVAAGACLRGDWGKITIGPGSNIQENCVIHALPGGEAVLGPRSHIGHGAILHTPKLGKHVFVGMRAVVIDHAEIGDDCLLGAGALVLENTVIPAKKLVLGSPAKVAGDLSEETVERLNTATDYYVALPERYRKGLVEISQEDATA